MPLYEFKNEEHGVAVQILFAVADRPGEIILKRASVPSRITVGTGARPDTHSSRVLKGYRKLESAAGGLSAAPGKSYLNANQIKAACALPDAPGSDVTPE